MDLQTIDEIVRRALEEDLPDITSVAIFEQSERGRARFIAKDAGILAGVPFAERTFLAIEDQGEFIAVKQDGDAVEAGDVIAEVSTSVIALLSAERTALNLLQRASGIATAT